MSIYECDAQGCTNYLSDSINKADLANRSVWCIFITILSDLEIPAPPPPLSVDCMDDGFEDVPPLPPPVDYDTLASAEYLEKGITPQLNSFFTHVLEK